jgi:hypothetical protein
VSLPPEDVPTGAPARPSRRAPRTAPKLSIGAVLSRTFSIWLRNFLPFLVLTIVVHLPLVALAAWVVGDDAEVVRRYESVWEPATWVLPTVLGVLLTAVLAYGVVQHLRGRPAPFRTVLRAGFPRLLPAAGAGILAGVLAAAPTLAVELVRLATDSEAAASGLGLVAAIFSMMIMSALWVTVPVAVMEGRGVTASLGRSLHLTRGSRWRIFAVNFVFGLLLVLGLVLVLLAFGGVATAEESTARELRREVLGILALTLLVAPLSSIASVVGYHDLRTKKEGVDVEELAKVFE